MTLELRFGSKAFESSTTVVFRRLANAAMWVVLVASASTLCQGCLVVPVRAPTHTNGFSGKMQKVDLDFLQAGKTARQEVTEKLGEIEQSHRTGGQRPFLPFYAA